MADKEDPRSKIVRLIREAEKDAGDGSSPDIKKKRKPRASSAKNSARVTVKGNSNVVGNGNVVAISPRVVRRTVVKTGDGVIDASQKRELTLLINEWVDSRTAVRRSKSSYGAAWRALNAHIGVNSYHEIPTAEFANARAWLQRQIGIINSMPSAPKRAPRWRIGKITSIKARCKNELRSPDLYRPYILRTFGVDSLARLDDDQLQQTYSWVFRQRV